MENKPQPENSEEETINFPKTFALNANFLHFFAAKTMMGFSIPFLEMVKRIAVMEYTANCMTVFRVLFSLEKMAAHYNKLAPHDSGAMILAEIQRIFSDLESSVVNKTNCPSIRNELESEFLESEKVKNRPENIPEARKLYSKVARDFFHIFGFCDEESHCDDDKEQSPPMPRVQVFDESGNPAPNEVTNALKKILDNILKGKPNG